MPLARSLSSAGGGQARVEADEVERRADPGDAGDDVSPAQGEVGPVEEVGVHAGAVGSRRSAAAVGRVRPRADEQRHVIVLVDRGDAEVERDVVEERRLGEHGRTRRKIRAHREDEAVAAADEARRLRAARVGARPSASRANDFSSLAAPEPSRRNSATRMPAAGQPWAVSRTCVVSFPMRPPRRANGRRPLPKVYRRRQPMTATPYPRDLRGYGATPPHAALAGRRAHRASSSCSTTRRAARTTSCTATRRRRPSSPRSSRRSAFASRAHEHGVAVRVRLARRRLAAAARCSTRASCR